MKSIKKVFILMLCVSVFSCTAKKTEFSEDGDSYILSMTPNVINRDASIIVTFTEDVQNTNAIAQAAVFTPEQKGAWELKDARTIVFTPEHIFTGDSRFELALDVGKILNKGANKIGVHREFYATAPKFDITIGELEAESNAHYELGISVATDINCSTKEVAKALNAKLNGSPCEIFFNESNVPTSFHDFKIKNIARAEKEQTLSLSYDARSIGFSARGTLSRTIPAEGVFDIVNVKTTSDKTVRFTFSELLDDRIDLREFISVTSTDIDYTYRWNVDRNNITVTCSRQSWPDDAVISILPNFKSAAGHTLKSGYDYHVVVGWEKPSLKFADNNAILPSDGKPVVVVYTKNLSGVIVDAVKIPQHNMLQFLQVNSLNGEDEMYRVGKSVWRKAFDFEWNDDMKNQFVTRGLDMTELVKQFPDGMFQLRITFAHRHSKYETASAENKTDFEFPSDFVNFSESSYSDYWNSVENKKGQGNYWEHSDDPNHPAYYLECYNSAVLKTKNVLVSNLALSVKSDTKGDVYIQAINLLTGEAEKNTDIQLYNFTQSLVEEGTADSNGSYKVKSGEDFTFIQAKSGNNYAYLDLRSAPLSTGNFQVGGVTAYDGVKGFVYGERGVWRPGDTLHLCLIIQDKEKTLPANVPVVFTLENPMGKIVDKKVLTEGVNGFYKVETATGKNDITGTWNAVFKTGNNVWSKHVKIESIIPNKLAVNLQVEKNYFNSGINNVSLSSEWLTGVKAGGLKSEIYSRYVSNNAGFEKFSGYNFSNLEFATATPLKKIWNGILDDQGHASFQVKLDAGKNVSGLLTAVLETRVYEPSGAYSIETKSVPFSPFPRYVGLKLPKSDDEYRDVFYTDKTHTAEIAVVDEAGNLVKENTQVLFSVYKLDWCWWWIRDAYTKASYDENRAASKVFTKEMSVKGGKIAVDFNLDDWGRYLFVVSDSEGGHSATGIGYVDYPYWATRNNTDVEGSANMLLLTSNKDTYTTNETAEVTFNANKNATAYITIEKNGVIIKQETVKAVDGTNTYRFKTDAAMAPNVYVHISLVQPYAQTANSMPLRMYGIIPIMIEDKTTHLNPMVKAAGEFKPNENCKLKVSEKDGKPATFTVAVVDEGLLGLTAFKTSNPWDYFYRKESSQLLSFDIFNFVSGAIKGELQTLITVGGGGLEGENLANKKAERFKPVVFYFGPFTLNKGETKELEFKMPEYIGEVRLMTVFANDTAYGCAEEKVKVKSDIMLSPTLPRTIGAGEQIEMPVTVFNTTDKTKKVSVNLEVKGAAEKQNTQTVELAANANKTVLFTVPFDSAGTVQVSFTAKEGMREVARSTTEIAVASRGTKYEDTQVFSLKPNEKIDPVIKTIGEKGTKELHIEVSKSQPMGIEKHLSSLLEFPHGCIEQITSKAFAQLYLDKMLNLTDAAVANIKSNINSVIARYPKYQLANGGFTYWQGGSYEYLWASAYVLHFLTEAKRAGYAVEPVMYNSLVSHLQNYSNSFSSSGWYDLNAQSYRLYVLALIGKPNIGAMNRLSRVSDLDSYAKALLALAYVVSGNEAQGQKLFNEIQKDFPSYRKTGGDFSSSIRDLAITCVVAKQINHRSAGERFAALAKLSNDARWLSTQEAAWVLIAASNFLTKEGDENVQYEINAGGQHIKNTLQANAEIHTIALDNAETQKLSVKNTGKAACFVTVHYTSKIPSGSEAAMQNGIALHVMYVMNGKNISVTELKPGDTFKTKLTVKNMAKETFDNLVLTFPIPTGWEISNERLGGEVADKNYSYLDIRDNCVYVHFDLDAGKDKTFEFTATLTYKGAYFVPAVTCEAMYDNAVKANNVGVKVNAY